MSFELAHALIFVLAESQREIIVLVLRAARINVCLRIMHALVLYEKAFERELPNITNSISCVCVW